MDEESLSLETLLVPCVYDEERWSPFISLPFYSFLTNKIIKSRLGLEASMTTYDFKRDLHPARAGLPGPQRGPCFRVGTKQDLNRTKQD